MIQERNFPTFLKKLTPAPKLWLALGLILAVLLLRNMYFSIAVALISVAMVIHEKQTTLFKVLLVTMTILFVSMYGIHGAVAPVIDKATDPVMFTVLGIDYYAKGFAYASRFFLRVCPLMCALFSIVKVQDQAVAMETKGFNSECKKTVYRELTPYKWDPVCKWFGILLGVFSIAYGVLSAVGVIPAFLTNIM